jgi:hypothetical protein
MVGPGRVRQLDGAFLYGHERFVADPEITPFWGNVRVAVTRPEAEISALKRSMSA